MARGFKTGGRVKGSQNRLTGTIKQMITAALQSELEGFPTLIEQLEPKDRVDVILKLLTFVVPKPDIAPEKPTNLMEHHSYITGILNSQTAKLHPRPNG